MQKKDDIVIGETGVALRHFLAHENLDSRIKSVDLHIIFDNVCLLGKNRSTADEHSQQRDTGFFHIVPPIFSLISNPLLCGYSNRSLRSARFSMAEHCFALQRTGRRTAWDVRFGSKADICAATSHVRFTPNNDRESGLSQKVMSALPPKADSCTAQAHVCYGPKADIPSLDHLVGTRNQYRRQFEAERLRRLEVNNELELSR